MRPPPGYPQKLLFYILEGDFQRIGLAFKREADTVLMCFAQAFPPHKRG